MTWKTWKTTVTLPRYPNHTGTTGTLNLVSFTRFLQPNTTLNTLVCKVKNTEFIFATRPHGTPTSGDSEPPSRLTGIHLEHLCKRGTRSGEELWPGQHGLHVEADESGKPRRTAGTCGGCSHGGKQLVLILVMHQASMRTTPSTGQVLYFFEQGFGAHGSTSPVCRARRFRRETPSNVRDVIIVRR